MKNNFVNSTVKEYLNQVGSKHCTPGGGNVLGLVNSLACGLVLMAARIKGHKELAKRLLHLKKLSIKTAQMDSFKFEKVMQAYRKKDQAKLPEALKAAAGVSLDTAGHSMALLKLINNLDLSEFTNILPDIIIAVELAGVCIKGSLCNCKTNLTMLDKPEITGNLQKQVKTIEGNFENIRATLEKNKFLDL